MDELHGLPKVAALASKLVDLVMDQAASDRCLNRENIRNAMLGPLVTFQLEADAAIARAAKLDVAAPKPEPLEFEQLLVNRINSAQAAVDRAAAGRAKVVIPEGQPAKVNDPDVRLWKNQTDDNLEALAIGHTIGRGMPVGTKGLLVQNLYSDPVAGEERRPGSLSKFAMDHSGVWMKLGRGVWSNEIPESAVLPNMETPIWTWTPCCTMRQLFWTDGRMLERRAYAEATGRCATLFVHLDLAITPEGEVISELEAIKRGAL
jgi:hypothetical protein